MIAGVRRLFSANFWTSSQKYDRCRRLMRRGFKIQTAFSPTRLSAEYLHTAYEIVTPMIKRRVAKEDRDTAPKRKRDEDAVPRRIDGARGGER